MRDQEPVLVPGQGIVPFVVGCTAVVVALDQCVELAVESGGLIVSEEEPTTGYLGALRSRVGLRQVSTALFSPTMNVDMTALAAVAEVSSRTMMPQFFRHNCCTV